MPGYHVPHNQIKELVNTIKSELPRNVTCKLETCSPYDESLCKALEDQGWVKGRTTQYSHTVQFDLTRPIEVLRAEMKKRARNEINRAVANDVQVIEQTITEASITQMYELLKNTASRKQFSVHDKNFLFTFWQEMAQAGRMRMFFAMHGTQIITAAVIILSQDGKQAWYKEGASVPESNGLNAPRYLLWEIAQALKVDGVESFDLGGVPDPATYESSSMKGIFIFKTAYTAEITRMMPAYELPINKTKYKLWPKTELVLRKLAHLRHNNWY